MEGSMSWLTIAAALFVLRFVASEALFEKSSSKNGKLIFRPVLGIRIIFNVGIPGSLFVAIRIAQTEDMRHSWYLFLFLPLCFRFHDRFYAWHYNRRQIGY